MYVSLEGRTALVTDAASPVGAAIARALGADGAKVLAFDLATGDPTALPAHEPIDVLVLLTGAPPEPVPLHRSGVAPLRTAIEAHYLLPATLLTAVLPGMAARGWGRIIHVSRLAASQGEAHAPAHAPALAAFDALMRNLAIDYSPRGVTANSIEVGPLGCEPAHQDGAPKGRRLAMAAAVRRLGEPEDVAAAVRYMASPAASFVTGEALRVTGGLHLANPLAGAFREAP